MAMRAPGCWFLNSLICSTAASQSSPVWTTRNRGWCSWSLLGSKSSTHDTEARMRKLAERRILASPSLSKMLFPTSIIAKDCRWRMGHSQHARILILDRPIELRPVIYRSLGVLASSVGGALRFHRQWLVVKFQKLRAYFFRETFLRSFIILDQYPRYPYISLVTCSRGRIIAFGGWRPKISVTAARSASAANSPPSDSRRQRGVP